MPDFDPTKNIRRQSEPSAPAAPLTTEQEIDRILADAANGSAFILERMKSCYERDRARIYANDNQAITPAAVYGRAGDVNSYRMAIAAIIAKSVINTMERVRTGNPAAKLIDDEVPEATITLPDLG